MFKLSLRGKFFLTLSVGAAALAAMFLTAFIGSRTANLMFTDLRTTDMAGRILALDIAKDINFFSRLTRNIMLGSNIDKDLEQIEKTLTRISTNFTTLNALAFTTEEKAIIRKAFEASQHFTHDGKEIVSGLKSVPPEDRHAAYKEYEKRATPFAMAFREHYGAFEKSMNERFERGLATMQATLESHRRLLLLILAGAVLALYGVGYCITNRDLSAMRRCIEFAKRLGADGDQVRRVEGRLASMRDLGEALSATAENLHAFRLSVAAAKGEAEKERDEARRALVEAGQARERAERARTEGMVQAAGQLEQVVGVVTSASAELTAQIAHSRRDTDLQSQRAGETATAMAQMNATVLEVARNAASAAQSASQARTKALDGAQAVTRVIGEIHAMQQVSETMKTDMGQLGRQAEGIGQIINVISDIADQTNLLALNAAIEAARAGDAGRGFAVVADEVRKLAEKTMVATKEVGEAIGAIQTGARKNLKTVDQVVSTVEAATRLARSSGEALDGIVALVEVSSDQVRNIATASDQQSATSDEINRSIEEMSRIANSTASAMNESARAVEGLSGQALGLRALIEKMKSPD